MNPTTLDMSSSTSSSSTSRCSSPVAGVSDSSRMNKVQEDSTMAGPSKTEPGTDIQDGIDRLLQRHRNELMYELRRLQHGHRPVTGQDNKRQVEDFFSRVLQQGDVVAPGSEPPRPEAVLVEVNALVERRPVTSMLQSAAFRASLENAVRGAISRVSSPNVTRPTHTAAASSNAGQPQPAPAQSGSAPQAQPRTSRSHRAPIPSPRSSLPASEAPTHPPLAQHAVPTPPPLPAVQQDTRAQAWLQQQPLQQFTGELGQQAALWENLEQSQRESLVMEISELVQQHLVSSSLESGFRNRLEGLMRDRLIESGTEGRRVQQFIQSLPRSVPHQRNDFSDLGIVPAVAVADSMSDDVSVISATAAVTVHNTQATAAMSREMTSLKAQIAELKNMMRLNFDLQLDIQRAIRQEVAAAVAGALQQTAPAPRPVSEGHCLICLESTVDSVLYQCGHMCVCHPCGLQLRSRGAHCPMCRAPIRDIIRAYKATQD